MKNKLLLLGSFISFLYSTNNMMKAEYIGKDWQTEMVECLPISDKYGETIQYPKPIMLKKVYSDSSLHATIMCKNNRLGQRSKVKVVTSSSKCNFL